ncbi:hypothetical protein B0H15DRAFT_1021130 [Mycena belliarum]|uniref:Uncharacterized protein n=1 Tax=Mycena belliarum TaxID=1033014 RepID=A0AAD6UBN9_9AGAR|nr:hypothetical protein B0H15DRAFT_1021130 [Mycena belliae]
MSNHCPNLGSKFEPRVPPPAGDQHRISMGQASDQHASSISSSSRLDGIFVRGLHWHPRTPFLRSSESPAPIYSTQLAVLSLAVCSAPRTSSGPAPLPVRRLSHPVRQSDSESPTSGAQRPAGHALAEGGSCERTASASASSRDVRTLEAVQHLPGGCYINILAQQKLTPATRPQRKHLSDPTPNPNPTPPQQLSIERKPSHNMIKSDLTTTPSPTRPKGAGWMKRQMRPQARSSLLQTPTYSPRDPKCSTSDAYTPDRSTN